MTARARRPSSGSSRRPRPRIRGRSAGLLARLDAAGLVRGARRRRPAGRRRRASRGIAVRGVAEDSREVDEGTLFVAVPGFHVDGHEFVDPRRRAGAAAAIVERAVTGRRLPQLVVVSARRPRSPRPRPGGTATRRGGSASSGSPAPTARPRPRSSPSRRWRPRASRSGLIGTVETRVGDVRERHEAHVTTPGAPELQATLRGDGRGGQRGGRLETTSHALELERVAGVAYDAAMFTNLTHEHLDLHGTFERYRAAKLRLFAALARGSGATPAKTVARPAVAQARGDQPRRPGRRRGSRRPPARPARRS